jgi:signal transduction histidine kinase
LTRIIEKRRSLHRNLEKKQKENSNLKMQIGQLQALANIGTTTCMIAHEINNLLTPLASYAQLALANPDDKALTEKALKKTASNGLRASKIMKSILSIGSDQGQDKAPTELKWLVDEIFSCLCRDFSKDSITVKIDIPEDLLVLAVPIEIQQVLMNLILNSRDAMLEKGGMLTIIAWTEEATVKIEVSDTGPGIEPELIERIFEPFFTTKKDKKQQMQNSGSGLGLAFCKKIIKSHDGSISVQSEPGKGTSFLITLGTGQ